MTSKDSNWEVGLVHELCPICCKETNSSILIPKQLTRKAAEEIRQAHGKAVGFSEPYEECQEYINKGYLALIGFDETKSNTKDGTVNLKDLYRIGLLWMRKETAEHVFENWFKQQRPESFILLESGAFNYFMEKASEPETTQNNEKSQNTEA